MRRILPGLLLAVLLAIPTAALAQDVGAALERQYGLVTDPAINARLNRAGTRIAAAVRRDYPNSRGRTLTFRVLRNQSLNAVSLPDGRIYVTSGMMQALANRPEDELAALLGHEAIHVAQRHAANQNRQALVGAIVGGVLGRAVGGSGGVSQGVRIGSALNSSMYSRDDEYRADAGGVRLLRTAGYDPYAMGRLLQILRDRYGRGSAKTPVIGWFASHPDTAKRVENANRVADQLTGRRPR